MTRQTFVLVHGSWHGGWCWTRVRDRLEALGHRVYTPTLTGLAERSHLLSTAVTLDTHITDIENLFLWEDITDAVLVGHSFGGYAISSVLDRIPGRVKAVVFLDAFYPQDGQSPLDLQPPAAREAIEQAIACGEAGRAPPPPAAFVIPDAEDLAWVSSKLTLQPYGTYSQTVSVKGGREAVAKKIYVRATDFPNAFFDRFYTLLQADPTWTTYAIKAGHDAMIDAPDAVTGLLIAAAG
jgi:pimeloyl-ACP methyl ester carboxylesterase